MEQKNWQDFQLRSLALLQKSAVFEDAASIIVEACQSIPAITSEALVGVMVTMRPYGGAINAMQYVSYNGIDRDEKDAIRTSASAWHLLEECCSAVSLEVLGGEIVPVVNEGTRSYAIETPTLLSESTILYFSEKETTHALLLPICYPLGALIGAVTLEVSDSTRQGEQLDWEDTVLQLQGFLSASAPWIPHKQQEITESPQDSFLPVCGATMGPIARLAMLFARCPDTLLISGPTGSGKTRIAKAIHDRSECATGPFVLLDLLSVPAPMQMARIFGWRKGAFTGADRDGIGELENASGGTLFLDEIDKLSMEAQAGLLRFLETGEFQRLGETRVHSCRNTRFAVGTNINLLQAVNDGSFRKDLYFRINVLRIELPSLQARRDEIASWAELFANEANESRSQQYGSVALTSDAYKILGAKDWPGNLRELNNVIRRTFAFATDDSAAMSGQLQIGKKHVELACSLDPRETHEAAGAKLESLAENLYQLAFNRITLGAARGGLGLKSQDVLLGAVWALANQYHSDDPLLVARLVDRESAVQSRNYAKEMRREISRYQDFLRQNELSGPSFLT